MNKIYKCKSPNLFELYEKANELAAKFKIIYFNHIYRNLNKRADQLSNIAVDLLINNKSDTITKLEYDDEDDIEII